MAAASEPRRVLIQNTRCFAGNEHFETAEQYRQLPCANHYGEMGSHCQSCQFFQLASEPVTLLTTGKWSLW